MTQTSIEWLENELADKLKSIVLNKDYILMESLFNKAKEMDNEQRAEVYKKGWDESAEFIMSQI